jgi:hypothetical protein
MKRKARFMMMLTSLVVVSLLGHAQKPTVTQARPGVPTYWVASEVILGPNVDFAIAVPRGMPVVGYKLQVAEGTESYSDPAPRDFKDCSETDPNAPPDSVTCGKFPGVSSLIQVFFTQFNQYQSRDGQYQVYKVQAHHSGDVRMIGRYAIQIQPQQK